MATPTSHPRPSPQKSHLTPTASGLSPPPPSSTHSQASKKPLHYRNGSLHQNQPSPITTPGGAGGIAMSRSGTANGTAGGTPMARSGTNTSSVGKTPVPVRAGRGMSASTTSAAGSPGLTAAANMIMQGGTGMTPQGGLGLGLTPLGMGMGTGSVVQGLAGMSQVEQEEERRRRVEVIKEMIGARAAGWVGQEGVERTARKVGLECLWEEGMGVGERRLLSIAGSGLLVEVDFVGDEVVQVGLSFPASKEGENGVGRWAKRGSEILKTDLRGNGADGYVGLEKFVGNLERLAKMDQLGGEEINCFDAVDGIFNSLERIYEWELNAVKKEKQTGAEDEVVCNYSGRPQMHVEHRIGLALQYWKDRRLVTDDSDTSEAMDLDNNEVEEDNANEAPGKPWSILIECEACSAALYDPMRLSDQWVSKDVEQPANQELDSEHISNDRIDWLDVKDLGFGEGKVPDVRFIAKLEPLVIVPLQLAIQIQQSVNAPVDQNTVLPTPYEALLFADVDAQVPQLTAPRTTDQTFALSDSNKPRRYTFALFNQSQDFAQAVAEIPFKHPMQIVSLLPTLRQWVLVGTLIRRSFTPTRPEDSPTKAESNTKDSTNGNDSATPAFQTLEEELADFLSSSPDLSTSDGTSRNALAVEVSFITSPLPRFTVHFQNPRYGGKLASVAFTVGLNGIFEGVEVDDGRPPPDGADVTGEATNAIIQMREKVRKVLEIGQSIGVLVEWLSRS